MGIPGKLFQNASCASNTISTLFCINITGHWVDTSAGGLFVTEGIINPVFSASVLTWAIRYIDAWNVQFLNSVIIIKANVLPLGHWWPQQTGPSWLCPLVYMLPKTITLFSFPVCLLCVYMMKAIPEMRCEHQIRYLRFYYNHWVDTSCILVDY